jgi:WD40 repeat protein
LPRPISEDRTVELWDLAFGSLLANLGGHSDEVTACAVTPDGRVVSASRDRTLKLWDLTSGQVLALEGHSDEVTACAVTRRCPTGVDARDADHVEAFAGLETVTTGQRPGV